jgi:glycosyltransferase involved in cell wall biosynthesis
MRIGLVSTPWVPVPPPAYGGLEAIVDRLARGLAADGHEVLLAAPSNSTCPVPTVEGLGEADPAGGIGGDAAIELNHVARAYAAMGSMDVIHDHTIPGPLYRGRPASVPVVATNHGPFDKAMNYLYGLMSNDTSIVAISANQASAARALPITRVIHHGLDLDRVPVGDGKGGYAAFLGRMTPDKGPREAIMVAREADVPLRIAAKMRERQEQQYFDDVIAPLLSDDIQYIGEVDEAGKYELLGAAFAMLNPIQWPEPFGLVMIEALACGTPVVTTSAGSVPEIIADGENGLISDDGTAGLAECVTRADQLDRARCREIAEARFSTERMVSEHVALYADLDQGGQSQRPPEAGRPLRSLQPRIERNAPWPSTQTRV